MCFVSRLKKRPIKTGSGKTLGQQLRLLRKQKGLSQERLGEQVGASIRAICSYERDECEPPVQTLMALSKTLGISMDDLLGSPAKKLTEEKTPVPRRWMRRIEKIQKLSENKQKTLLQVVDMALNK